MSSSDNNTHQAVRQTRHNSSRPAGGGTTASDRLAAGRAGLIERRLNDRHAARAGIGFARAHSRLIDTFLQERLRESNPAEGLPARRRQPSFAILAVGGYGRRELCLHSDIDLLLVSQGAIPTQALDLAQPIFLPLWDLGYELGHGFRTVADCIDLAKEDFQVLTSLLDLRFIAGARLVCEQLHEQLLAQVLTKKRTSYLDWLAAQHQERQQRYGDAGLLLEPQLKNGLGGLRDYHSMLWLSRLDASAAGNVPAFAVLAQRLAIEELRSLRAGVDFLLRVRNVLHQRCERKNDTLHLDLQPDIAVRLGFGDRPAGLAVEAFLGCLHRRLSEIKVLARVFWKHNHGPRQGAPDDTALAVPEARGLVLRNGELCFDDASAAETTPMLLMDIFVSSARTGTPLSWAARRAVTARLHVVKTALADSPEAWNGFKSVLFSGSAATVLEAMLETGFLSTFIPEFGRVADMVQFDAYHTRPVGPHTLKTVEWLETLACALEEVHPAQRRMRDYVERAGLSRRLCGDRGLRERVLLGAFFHDFGKGEPEHERRGGSIAEAIFERFAEPDAALCADACFLVRNHLLLAITATRRDLGDESVVVDCAGRVGSAWRLDMLYLLTCADAQATGPKAWNEWTARLLAELYDKALKLLDAGFLAEPHAAQRMMKTRDTVRTLIARRTDATLAPEIVERCLDALPSRYVLTVEPGAIVGHIVLVRELERALDEEERRLGRTRSVSGVVALDARILEPGIWSVAFAARKQAGLFPTIAGVLALHGINIYGADSYVWGNGVVVAVCTVSEPPDPLYAEEFWGRVRSSLKFALTGKLSLDWRLSQKRASPLADNGRPGCLDDAVRVVIDNAATDFYTVIEVVAHDRIGLLYDILHCLHDLHIEVHVAKAATHADRVADVFYVRDIDGQKIEDEAQCREIRKALTHCAERLSVLG